MIDSKKFLNWAIARFGEENIVATSKEIKINSIFEPDDNGYHLWCSPSGGKKKHKYGVYRCLKTDQSGNLIKLIRLVDHCDREDALAILAGRTSIYDLEKKLEAMFAVEEEAPPVIKQDLTLPIGCELISNLGTNNWWRKIAEPYLVGRKIPIDGLYICTNKEDKKYKGRVIIPYYDRQGKLIYFNARAIGKSKCKYLGPEKEIGVGKGDVVFMAGPWPKAGETLHICEGEFNAISLKIAELNAVACGGKSMSEKQALLISDYNTVLCLDRDKAGKAGTIKMSSMVSAIRSLKTNKKLSYVFPPLGYNDWNEFLVKNNAEMLHYYVQKNKKTLDDYGPIGTAGDFFGFL